MPNSDRVAGSGAQQPTSSADSAKWTILAEAIRQADESAADVEGIRIDAVLAAAHASSSSLYHHFGNRAGLIEAVRIERQRRGFLAEDRTLLDSLESITTNDEFCSFMASQLHRIATDPDTIARRWKRLEALAQPGADRPIDHQMRRLLDSTSAFMSDAIAHGVCNPDLDADAYAVVFMSLSLGQIATRNLGDADRWLELATSMVIAPLRF
ncbi:MAG: TetR family transcriptional regulator [Ilumatobacteraceae bacterium]